MQKSTNFHLILRHNPVYVSRILGVFFCLRILINKFTGIIQAKDSLANLEKRMTKNISESKPSISLKTRRRRTTSNTRKPPKTKAKYISVETMIETIQYKMGCTIQEATGELLDDLRKEWFSLGASGASRAKHPYPTVLMQMVNKFTYISPKTLAEEDVPESDLATMSTEELEELAKKKAAELLGKAA